MSEANMDNMVKAYLSIRGEREKIYREYQLKDADLKEQLSRLEQAMLEKCNDINADSIRTGHGTIIKSMREDFVCSDWDNFKKFIIENDAIELLQQRISQSNFKEYTSTHKEDGLPPGISTMRSYKVTVRKPTRKE